MKGTKTEGKRVRLSVDLEPQEKRRIKAFSALNGVAVSRFVLEAVNRRIAEMKKARSTVRDKGNDDGLAGSLAAYADPRRIEGEKALAWDRAVKERHGLH